ncbi:MAG: hypothetical protein G01um101456_109 [Parcubacteria group bacterium Gr01-1014_56]|nr:MAG: hypothetical protein G01um101456_109 [Parcubacteria group bacterium Gr01-1014_56]
MYAFEINAIVATVSTQIKASGSRLTKGKVNLLAREAIRRRGITYEPDVKRIAQKICSELGRHSAQARRTG